MWKDTLRDNAGDLAPVGPRVHAKNGDDTREKPSAAKSDSGCASSEIPDKSCKRSRWITGTYSRCRVRPSIAFHQVIGADAEDPSFKRQQQVVLVGHIDG